MGLITVLHIFCVSVVIFCIVSASAGTAVPTANVSNLEPLEAQVEDVQNCWVTIEVEHGPNDPDSSLVNLDKHVAAESVDTITAEPATKVATECVILNNMKIRNDSAAYSVWRRPSSHPLFKVRLFNYINWEQFKNGSEEKLRVNEVGPYVYSQRIERDNIHFTGDQLSFQERKYFIYLPNKTAVSHLDHVTVPNMPLIGVVSKLIGLNLNAFVMIGFNYVAGVANHPEAFTNLPASRFLWGYEDTLMNIIKPILNLQSSNNTEKYGLLQNNTVSETITINTGETDINKMNLIEKLDNQPHLSYWNDQKCNRLDASDGSIFPPSMLDKKQTLYVFHPQLCRRLPFVFEKEVEIKKNLNAYRYRMPRNVFDDPAHNPDNSCFCDVDSVCPPRGVINVTECAKVAEFADRISFPHFFLGDEKLREDVLGLQPDETLHDSYIDIHPTLGISLQGRFSYQLNIQVRKNHLITHLKSLPDGLILPIAWIEMEWSEFCNCNANEE